MLRWLVATFVAFGLWLVVHAAGAAEPPKVCGAAIAGEIDPPNDARQTGRITQGFGAGKCDKPITAPPETTPGVYGYEAHTFKNRTEQTCIQVTLTLTSTTGNLSAAAYAGAFDPNNITARFAGGTSNAVVPAAPKRQFSFNAPVLSDFTVVVSAASDGTTGQYQLAVEGCGQVLVRQVEPNYGPVRGGTPVTLRGAGFQPDAKVTFGGAPATDVTVEDEFTLHATTPAFTGGGASPHAVDVAVANVDGTTGTKVGGFTYYDPQPSIVTLGADASPSRVGQVVTFTAHVGPDTPQRATGAVEFLRDGTVFGTGTLDAAGNATASVSNLHVGRHAIAARYEGDDYHAANDATVNHEVLRADTATSLSSSKEPASPEEGFILMATVAAVAPGAGKPTGTVFFRQGTTDLGTVDLYEGRASFFLGPLAVGDYSYTASFSGNRSFNASTSPVHVQHVKYAKTGLLLTPSRSAPVAFGTEVTFTAAVTVVGDVLPTGNVTFEDASTTPPTFLGKGALDAAGRASITPPLLPAGARSIRATFDDPGKVFETASASIAYQINKAPTLVTLTSSKNPGPSNGWVTLTAKVSSLAGGATVRGFVEFRQNETVLGTVVLGPNGTAAIDTRRLLLNSYNLVAEYKESDSFAGSKAALVLLVGNGVADAGTDSGRDGGRRDAGPGPGTPIHYDEWNKDGCNCSSTGSPASGLSFVAATGLALLFLRRRRGRR